MSETLLWLLSIGSYPALIGLLVLGGVGAPLPEDALMLMGGAVAHKTGGSLPLTMLSGFIGAWVADLMLFSAGQRMGRSSKLTQSPRLQRFSRSKFGKRLSALLVRHPIPVLLLARFIGPLRMPVFVTLGASGLSRRRFAAWDALGLSLTAPLTVWLGYRGAHHLEATLAAAEGVRGYVWLAVAVLLTIGVLVLIVRHVVQQQAAKSIPAE